MCLSFACSEAELEAKARKDDPTYYANNYAFNNKNLFGRRSSDPMQLGVIPEKKGKKQLVVAQHELLAGIYWLLDRTGAVQVVQRLAPSDIHNYVAPLDGTPLRPKAARSYVSVTVAQRRLPI